MALAEKRPLSVCGDKVRHPHAAPCIAVGSLASSCSDAIGRHRAPAHLWRPMALYGVVGGFHSQYPPLPNPSRSAVTASLFFALWRVRREKPCSFPAAIISVDGARSFCEFPNEKLVDAGRSFNRAEEFVRGDAR